MKINLAELYEKNALLNEDSQNKLNFAPFAMIGLNGIRNNYNEAPALASVNRNDASALAAVDPATIELIIEIGVLLIALFDEDDGSDAGLWLEEISSQLDKMERTLKTILEALQDLGVLLDELFRRDVQANVLAACTTWVDNAADVMRDRTSERNIQYMDRRLDEIQTSIRKLMVYGYAGAYWAFYGLRYEVDLIYLLGKSREVKQAVFKRYIDYFDSALNPNIPSSVVNQLKKFEDAMAPLTSAAPPSNGEIQYFDSPRYWWSHDVCRVGRETDQCRDYYVREHFKCRVNGSLENGFTGELLQDGGRQETTTKPHEYFPSHRHAYDVVWGIFQSHLAGLNDKARQYQRLKKQRDALVAAKSACENFKSKSAALLQAAN